MEHMYFLYTRAEWRERYENMNKALTSGNSLHSMQFLKANLSAVVKTFQELLIQILIFMTHGISEWGIKTMFILQGVINTNPFLSVSFSSALKGTFWNSKGGKDFGNFT